MDIKTIFRRKIILIPYTVDGRFMFVRDRISKEWGFISGGVKRNESVRNAAVREFSEETSNLYKRIPFDRCKTFKYYSDYRPSKLLALDIERSEHVVSNYTIYMFPVHSTQIYDFKPNNEITSIRFCKYDQLDSVWELTRMIYNEILIC